MLMVCEMSGNYGLLVPLMLVAIINVAILSSRWTLYEEQVFALGRQPGPSGRFRRSTCSSEFASATSCTWIGSS